MVNPQRPVKPKPTSEEKQFRKELFSEPKDIVLKNPLCTSCGRSVKDLISKGKPIRHPFLGTLLCEKCSKFYGDGQFSEDEDGCDKYCRWCGQGGTLFLCSLCTAGFCKKCVKRNLPRSALQELENDDWQCYCCNTKPLFELRAFCWAAMEYAESLKMNKSSNSKSSSSKKRKAEESSSDEEEKNKSRKKKKAQDSDDEKSRSKKKKKTPQDSGDEDEKPKNKNNDLKSNDKEDRYSRRRSKPVEEPERKVSDDEKPKRKSLRQRNEVKNTDDDIINGLKKSQWNKAVKQCEDVASDVAKITKEFHKKILEYRVKKINLKHINTCESLLEVNNHVSEILTTLIEASEKIKSSFSEYCKEWIKEANVELEKAQKLELLSENEIPTLENGIADDAMMDVDDESNSVSKAKESEDTENSANPEESSSTKIEECSSPTKVEACSITNIEESCSPTDVEENCSPKKLQEESTTDNLDADKAEVESSKDEEIPKENGESHEKGIQESNENEQASESTETKPSDTEEISEGESKSKINSEETTKKAITSEEPVISDSEKSLMVTPDMGSSTS